MSGEKILMIRDTLKTAINILQATVGSKMIMPTSIRVNWKIKISVKFKRR